MKTFNKLIIALIGTMPVLTGCIEEVQPTNAVTQAQLNASSKATEALVWAMPSYQNSFDILGQDQAYDWGYGSLMHIRDVMTEDMAIMSSGYDWYTAWEFNRYLGPQYARQGFIWQIFCKMILTANNVIGAIDEESANETQKAYLGMGYAYRALYYLDMARMYEFLPNSAVPAVSDGGHDIEGLTVPIVTEKTTEEEARNNPRVSHEVMAEFILSDLQKAEELIGNFVPSSKTLPDLSVVYGLYARLYMWNEDYENAALYAGKAIVNFSGSITTEDEWLNTSSGFNDLSTPSWMLGSQQMKEDAAVQSALLNWTSWVSNETTFGYACAGPMMMIGKSTYDAISDDDFRKLSYVAPEGSPLSGKEQYVNLAGLEDEGVYLEEYCSLKFRPGSGNIADFNVACATAYPLMRIEEMYLIQAEAEAHSNPANGKVLLEEFMQYRCPGYTCTASDVVKEIVFQKRVELWGEGQSYFDIKRLNYPVTRYYEGTNFQEDAQINTTDRPAWMNIVIVRSEASNNNALQGWNNPDPSGAY